MSDMKPWILILSVALLHNIAYSQDCAPIVINNTQDFQTLFISNSSFGINKTPNIDSNGSLSITTIDGCINIQVQLSDGEYTFPNVPSSWNGEGLTINFSNASYTVPVILVNSNSTWTASNFQSIYFTGLAFNFTEQINNNLFTFNVEEIFSLENCSLLSPVYQSFSAASFFSAIADTAQLIRLQVNTSLTNNLITLQADKTKISNLVLDLYYNFSTLIVQAHPTANQEKNDIQSSPGENINSAESQPISTTSNKRRLNKTPNKPQDSSHSPRPIRRILDGSLSSNPLINITGKSLDTSYCEFSNIYINFVSIQIIPIQIVGLSILSSMSIQKFTVNNIQYSNTVAPFFQCKQVTNVWMDTIAFTNIEVNPASTLMLIVYSTTQSLSQDIIISGFTLANITSNVELGSKDNHGLFCFTGKDNNKLQISQSSFQNLSLGTYIINADNLLQLMITQTVFQDLTQKRNYQAIQSGGLAWWTLDTVLFNNVNCSDVLSGCIFSTWAIDSPLLKIQDSNFTNIIGMSTTLFNFNYQEPSVSIENSNFSNNFAESNGLFCFQMCNNLDVVITNSIFEQIDLQNPSLALGSPQTQLIHFSFAQSTGNLTISSSNFLFGSSTPGVAFNFLACDTLNILFLNSKAWVQGTNTILAQGAQSNSIALSTSRILNTNSTYNLMGLINIVGSGNVALSNFTFDGANIPSISPIVIMSSKVFQMIIENCVFQNGNMNTPLISGITSLQITNIQTSGYLVIQNADSMYLPSTTLTITSSKFLNYLSINDRGCIQVYPTSNGSTSNINLTILLEGSTFINNSAIQGAAVNIETSSFITNTYQGSFVNITNCVFVNNTAKKGHAIFDNAVALLLQNNTFIMDFNYVSNFVFCTLLGGVNTTQLMLNNTFNYTNQTVGKTYQILDPIVFSGQPTFMRLNINESSFINYIQGFEARLIKNDTPSQPYAIVNATTYSLQNLMLSTEIYDQYNNIYLDFSSWGSLGIFFSSQSSLTSSVCNFGKCFLNKANVSLSGQANQEVQLILGYKSDSISLNQTLSVSLRACAPGEINDTQSQRCLYCTAGFYSLNPSDSVCQPCLSSVDCLGGVNLSLNEGFWRSNTTSITILGCEEDSKEEVRCLGGYNSNCSTGYKGPLCMQCDSQLGYGGNLGEQKCTLCPPLLSTILIWIFLRVINYAYVLWVFKEQKRENEELLKEDIPPQAAKELRVAIYLELLTTYGQIMFIISDLDSDIRGLFGFTKLFGLALQSLIFPESCLFMRLGMDETSSFYMMVWTTLLTPILLWLITYAFYYVAIYKFELDDQRKRRFWLMGVCFFTFQQPLLVSTMLRLLSCRKFDTGSPDTYLSNDPAMQCNTLGYQYTRSFVLIPFGLFWGLIIPCIMWLALYKNRTNLNKASIKTILGSYVNPYKSKAYFWGVFVLFFKVGLLVCTESLRDSLKLRVFMTILSLYIYKWMLSYFEPYREKQIHTGVLLSLYAYLITVFLAYFSDGESPAVRGTCIGLIILINVISMTYLLFFILRHYHKVAYKNTKRASQTFRNLTFILKSWLSASDPSDLNSLPPNNSEHISGNSETIQSEKVPSEKQKTILDVFLGAIDTKDEQSTNNIKADQAVPEINLNQLSIELNSHQQNPAADSNTSQASTPMRGAKKPKKVDFDPDFNQQNPVVSNNSSHGSTPMYGSKKPRQVEFEPEIPFQLEDSSTENKLSLEIHSNDQKGGRMNENTKKVEPFTEIIIDPNNETEKQKDDPSDEESKRE